MLCSSEDLLCTVPELLAAAGLAALCPQALFEQLLSSLLLAVAKLAGAGFFPSGQMQRGCSRVGMCPGGHQLERYKRLCCIFCSL